jgi:hypothetical protein
MATLLAIPLILRKRRARLQLTRAESGVHPFEEERRRDLFDLIT